MAGELRFPGDFAPARAAQWFHSWQAEGNAAKLRLVLPEELGPSGQVLIAAGVAGRARRGLTTDLVAPTELQRSLASMSPVRSLADARTQAEAAGRALERELEGVAPSPLRMARFVCEELGANVVQHSGAPETGFGALDAFPRSKRIELAFADAGMGFLASLQRNPELAGRVQDDGEALQLALGKGVSGTGTSRRNMGLGLGLLQDFADRLGGELWLASGGALLRRRTTAGTRTNTVQAIPVWAGSWIALEAELG